jgi:RNA polymerase sigma-70 factor (ECF subfamily)
MTETASSPPDGTIADLVRAAAAGDRTAFGHLVERYETRVRAVALALGADPATADDVAQETFLAAHKGLGGIEEPAAFPGWIVRVAHNAAVTILRRRGVSPEGRADFEGLAIASPADTPERAASRESVRGEVRQALQRLDERERLAITLRHHAGLTYAQIAEAMAIPHSTIKGLLERATNRLRERLAGLATLP